MGVISTFVNWSIDEFIAKCDLEGEACLEEVGSMAP